jgi:hypothetical protein
MEAFGGARFLDMFHLFDMFVDKAQRIIQAIEKCREQGVTLKEEYVPTAEDKALVRRILGDSKSADNEVTESNEDDEDQVEDGEENEGDRKTEGQEEKATGVDPFVSGLASLVSILGRAPMAGKDAKAPPRLVTPLLDSLPALSPRDSPVPMALSHGVPIDLDVPSIIPGRIVSPRAGLKNTTWSNNGCFGDCLTQALFILMAEFFSRGLTGGIVFQELQVLYDQFRQGGDVLISLTDFRAAVASYEGYEKYAEGTHQDAAKFFAAVLKCLDRELAEELPTEQRPNNLLQTIYHKVTTCEQCPFRE